MNKPGNLLFVRTDRIGDVILSLPLAGLVKKYYPECKVTFLVREYTHSLIEDHPHIDNVITLTAREDKIPLMPNVQKIKAYNFDTAIIIYPTFYTSLVIYLSGIKKRIGTGYRWYSSLFNNKIYEHRKYAERHELEYNVNLLKSIGIQETVSQQKVSFEFSPSSAAQRKIDDILLSEKIVRPFLIIHPGSGGSSVDLPKERFKELVDMIDKNLPVQIILTGSEQEQELCSFLEISENLKNLAGKLALPELTALISRSFLFISNSTGPIHIAAALNVYTIGFYPKILACSAERWGPYSLKTVIFKPEIDCSGCSREQCERLNCMNSIKVTDIFAEIEKIYKFIVNNGETNA